MASPVDAGRALTNISTAADPWTVNLPGTIAAGDLLVMFTRQAGTVGGLGAAGWVNPIQDATDASDDFTEVWAKTADGTEGATISWDMGSAIKGAAICWRITGSIAAVFAVANNPECSTATVTTAANIDPASFTPAKPGGSKDYLWLSLVGMDSETGTATNGTLSNVVSANSGTAGAVATNCIIWGGSLASTASSINIAAWTSSAPNSGATALTVAVYPVVATAVFGTKERFALQAVNRSSVW